MRAFRLISRIRGLRLFYAASGVGFFLLCLCILFFTPPLEQVRYPQVFAVSRGETIRAVADGLRERNFIISPSLFILSVRALGENVRWGSYHFTEPRSVFSRSRELYRGDHGTALKRVVIPEGSNVYEIADIFDGVFADFDKTAFQDYALEYHGYLYPDTYFFPETDISPHLLTGIMTETFKRRTADLFRSYDGPFSEREIITLASIVELEARRRGDREKIASVLFNRLEAGIPLQVDVSFLFISGKHTFTLNRSDLRTDDPSNTYRYRGIPPIPITNPGRDAVEAVLSAPDTDYLYFLADFGGTTHFSITYEEHLRKKELYIDSVIRERRRKASSGG